MTLRHNPASGSVGVGVGIGGDPLEMLSRRGSLPSSSTSAFHDTLVSSGLLRAGDSLVQMVRLESQHPERERFLCIVSSRRDGRKRSTVSSVDGAAGVDSRAPSSDNEFCLLGIDRGPRASSRGTDAAGEMETTVGMVARLTWDVKVSLDGDGGFSLRRAAGRTLILKPASVQALWTVIQALHMIVARLAPQPDSQQQHQHQAADKRLSERSLGSVSDWELAYPITSSQSCVNDWNRMADLLVMRPTSPESWDRQGPETVIKGLLRKVMKSADLDSITSKGIRTQLEAEMGESLEKYKSFIDKEMLLILGQMDPASKITDYLYLGSEWNASNLEELQQNGITHILNVTREIDNFFPAVFTYKNVREYDEESTELMKYFDRTYKFIRGAKESGGKVLVHCKMGISRSATVTISYVMKEYRLSLEESLKMVRSRRSIVRPNKSFLKQLEVYEGILGAISHRHTYLGLFRSRSESSLIPSPIDTSANYDNKVEQDYQDDDEDGQETGGGLSDARLRKASRSSPVQIRVDIKALATFFNRPTSEPAFSYRPKSWSPSEQLSQLLFPAEEDCGRALFRSEEGKKAGADEGEDEECNCFGELSNLSEKGDGAQDVGTLAEDSVVEARNPNMSGMVSPSGAPQPVNSSLFNPECGCDMELELTVPEDPVSVSDLRPDRDVDAVVRGMSNVPLQVRSALPDAIQKQAVTPPISLVEHHLPSGLPSPPPPPPPPPPTAPLLADEERQGVEEDELSVKTLASMFDYKVGSVPYRTCSARLEENKLFQRAKKLAGEVPQGEESNC